MGAGHWTENALLGAHCVPEGTAPTFLGCQLRAYLEWSPRAEALSRVRLFREPPSLGTAAAGGCKGAVWSMGVCTRV